MCIIQLQLQAQIWLWAPAIDARLQEGVAANAHMPRYVPGKSDQRYDLPISYPKGAYCPVEVNTGAWFFRGLPAKNAADKSAQQQ